MRSASDLHRTVPDPLAATVTILELEDREHVERGVVGPGEDLIVSRPYEVRLAPAERTRVG